MMDRELNNPFSLLGNTLRKYFCDRKEELKHLEEHFRNERNVVIYSWRRMGKTSLIKFFLSDLEKKKQAEVLYVDFLPTFDIHDAIRQITQATYMKYGRTKSGFSTQLMRLIGSIGLDLSIDPVTYLPIVGLGLKPTNNPESSLEAIGQFLSERKVRVIIAIDEFQQIGEYERESGEAVFRTWMQNFPGIRFIFSGSHRHMMASMFSEKNRPFYRSCQLMALNPIPLKIYTPFIKKHFEQSGRKISAPIIAKIYEWCRGQTYCVQLICNKLYGRNIAVSQADLDDVIHEMLEQESPNFAQFFNLMTKLQGKVLRAIAAEGYVQNPLAKKFIKTHDLGAASSVSTALKMLVNKQIVVTEDGGYQLHDVLLMRWLQRI